MDPALHEFRNFQSTVSNGEERKTPGRRERKGGELPHPGPRYPMPGRRAPSPQRDTTITKRIHHKPNGPAGECGAAYGVTIPCINALSAPLGKRNGKEGGYRTSIGVSHGKGRAGYRRAWMAVHLKTAGQNDFKGLGSGGEGQS